MDAHQAHLEALKLNKAELEIDRHVMQEVGKIKARLQSMYALYADLIAEINKEVGADRKKATDEQLRKLKEENVYLTVTVNESSAIMSKCNGIERNAKEIISQIEAIKSEERKHLFIDKRLMLDTRKEK